MNPQATIALPGLPNGPKLDEEQLARKAWLLSRFRTFAKHSGMVPLYEDQPHNEMADEMEMARPDIGIGRRQKKAIYLAPRGTYKTTLEKAFMAWLILWYLEYGIHISIDYVRAEAKLAEDVLFEWKNDMVSCEPILELWGNLEEQSNLWSAQRINLSGRRDHTINAYGLDRGTAGKHPDVALLDDMVTEKNFESIKAKRASRVKVQSYSPVLRAWGSLFVSGTRFAHNDVYGWLLDQNAKDRREYQRLLSEGKLAEAAKVEPQWREYIRRVHDKEGNLFFPVGITEPFLEQQKRSMEARFYAAWYENDPDVEGMVRFKPEYLQYFSAQLTHVPTPALTIMQDAQDGRSYPIETFPVRVTMTLDPTLTAHQTSDRTGISVVADDAIDNWWVLYAASHLEVPSVIGERAIELIRKYRPSVFRIESANADVEMVARIQQAILAERLPTVIRSYSALQDESGGSIGRPSRRKKNARIEALEPRFRNGKIRLMRGACGALYDQYIHWPDVDFDDVFDSLAMHVGVAKPCQYKTIEDAQLYDIRQLDEEPGKNGQFTQTLFDRNGQPVRITFDYHEGEEPQRLGRAGLASQRIPRQRVL